MGVFCTLSLMIRIFTIIFHALQHCYDKRRSSKSWSLLLMSPLAENSWILWMHMSTNCTEVFSETWKWSELFLVHVHMKKSLFIIRWSTGVIFLWHHHEPDPTTDQLSGLRHWSLLALFSYESVQIIKLSNNNIVEARVKASKLTLSHLSFLKGIYQHCFSFCYLPPSRVPDKKIDTILLTVCAVTRKRRTELDHR